MRIQDLTDLTGAGTRLFDQLGDAAGRMLEGEIRLGVTGLRRAGKTVFVTALVDNLLKAGRLPFLDVMASGRFRAARLKPQPDADVPRFEYERHLEALTGPAPDWPQPTRGISQLRLAIRYRPGSALRRAVQTASTLNLVVVDYPGEWLLDLPLLRLSFAQWSTMTLDMARHPPRAPLSADWLAWADSIDPAAPAEEEDARRGAALYTAYLHACRRIEPGLSLIQPGRFVEPGDMKNAPLLTFCPLPGDRRGRHSLWALMEERYDAYKTSVVRRFFTEHFARLDRQVVLIDVLGALNAGPIGLADMKRALQLSLEPFRHGSSGWLDWLLGTRIDRVLFAATKADHIAASQHGNLKTLLDGFVAEARSHIRFEGAAVETMALASLKCTDTVITEHEGRQLRCVRGIPVGRDRPTVLFPGDIPPGHEVFPPGRERPYSFLSFKPPAGAGADGRGLPHVRLDQALQFLLGDYLE
ncbi:YcjX family protein [Azospirillum halopraeferens]|uniref:YcjX family protein n=1 Tax=Azospirillum halopraeferens TaxID=34010 RepID=UPI0004025786|nr:YcjX family protein [Azospirillum halopraeferens]